MSAQRWSVYDRRLTDREALRVAIELADRGDNLHDLRPLLLKEGGLTLMELVDFLAPRPAYSFDERDELLGLIVDAAGWNRHPLPPDVVLPPSSKLWPTFDGTGYALVKAPHNGPCTIIWIDGDKMYATGDTVDGFIVGEHLFWPGTNQSIEREYITNDGQPDPDAPWADVETGQPAIIGLPGSPLAVLV
jgi:hypothetical protein